MFASSAGVTNLSSANNLVLGAEPAVGIPTFIGKLDEVAFFSRALGASEVQSLFDAPIGNANTDQRGFARLVGAHEDIGATEYQYNLGVSINAPATVTGGGTLTFTLTLTNNGPDSVLGASLTDLLPQGVTFQSWTAPKGWATTTPAIGQGGSVTAVDSQLLAAGASVTFTLTVQVPPGTATGTTLSDMAWVSPFSWDLFGADNTATSNTTVL